MRVTLSTILRFFTIKVWWIRIFSWSVLVAEFDNFLFFHIEMSCCFHAQIPFSFSDDWHLCLFQFPKTFRSPSNLQTKRLSTLFSVSIVALISSVNPLLILYLAIIEALVIFVFIPIAQKLGWFGIVISPVKEFWPLKMWPFSLAEIPLHAG